ncbi:hypothetical protein [Micromonospora sp. DT31]|uniref:hypothetical protein n=1 Tax=Micromonospora sp. DT31 TaxID=3393434 RepID=UPI003CEEF939
MPAPTLALSKKSQRIAGLLLLSIVGVEAGGYYMTKVARGQEQVTEFQENFSRAGHAHAGVLVTLALIMVVVADATSLRGPLGYIARLGVPLAAILMPAGFFLSSTGAGTTEPNGAIVLLWLGAVSLAVGVVSLGLALVASGFRRDPNPATPESNATHS